MSSSFQIYAAPVSALQDVVDGNAGAFTSSNDCLSEISDFALARLQALLDGVDDWGESYEKVAIEMEDGEYAESHDGAWARVLPDRFCRATASLTAEQISRVLPEWSSPDTHAGLQFSAAQCRLFLEELRRIATDAIQNHSSLIIRAFE